MTYNSKGAKLLQSVMARINYEPIIEKPTTDALWSRCDDFTRGYVIAALWSSTDDDGEPLDCDHDYTDLAPETLQAMMADCERFQRENRLFLAVYEDAREHGEWSGAELAGHDFWLTRNGHGAGFWDRFQARAFLDYTRDDPRRPEYIAGRIGDRLTKRCGWRTSFPEVNLYVGDDGQIYAQ